jgi:hypothetical protein
MTCARPIASEQVVDYWARALALDEEQRLEEHVFDCDDCAGRWQAMRSLVDGIVELTKRASAQLALTPRIAARLETEALHLRIYRAAPGDVVACGVSAADELVVTWLSADFSGVERVDLISTSGGRTLRRYEDVPIDRANNRIGYALPAELVRTWPSMKIDLRVVAVESSGERTIASYIFDHTGFST